MCRTAICPYFSGPPFCHFSPRRLYGLSVKFHLRLTPSSDGPPLTLAKTNGDILKVLKDVERGLLQNDTNSFLSKVLSIESWYKTTIQDNVSIVDFIFTTVVAKSNHPFYMKEMYKWLDDITRHMSPLEMAGVKLYLEIDNRAYEEKMFRIFVTNVLYNGEELAPGDSLGDTYAGINVPLLLNKFYFCRQVELGSNDFQLTENEIIVSLSKDVKVKLNNYHIIKDRFGNDSARVCIDDLLTIQLGTSASPRPKLHIISLVLCSVVSLLLIIGYELKSERYINIGERHNLALAVYNIIVEICFGLAQQPWNLSNWTLCPVVGLLNHLFGLHFVVWLMVCAYYSYRQAVVMSHESNQPLKYMPMQITFLCTCSLSGVFVSVSVFVYLLQSDATQIGYGTDGCFLSTLVMAISTFILPVGVFTTFSVICLTIALNCFRKTGNWRIQRAGKLVFQRVTLLLLMALMCLVIVGFGIAYLVFGHQWMRLGLETLVAGFGVWWLCFWLLVQACSELLPGQCV